MSRPYLVNTGTAELNPGDYCGRRDHQYSLNAGRTGVIVQYPLCDVAGLVIERDLRVNARSRAQARKIAERAGYEVYSVNLIG